MKPSGCVCLFVHGCLQPHFDTALAPKQPFRHANHHTPNDSPSGDRGAVRTRDLLFRKQLLYPTELRSLCSKQRTIGKQPARYFYHAHLGLCNRFCSSCLLPHTGPPSPKPELSLFPRHGYRRLCSCGQRRFRRGGWGGTLGSGGFARFPKCTYGRALCST